MSSATYTNNIVNLLLIPFWYETCERYGWAQVVKDGAPRHKGVANACQEINCMESLEWSPQLSDLNLMEAL